MKKLLLSLLALVASMGAFQASAITVDDLDGKLCLQFFYGNNAQDMLGVSTCTGYFQKISNNKVAVIDFKGYYNVEFTLSNNKLSLTTVSYMWGDYYNTTWYNTDETRYIMFDKVTGYTSTINGYPASGYVINNNDQTLSSSAYATIKDGLNGFAFIPESGSNTRPFAIEEYYDSNDALIEEWVYHGMYLFVIEPNAVAIRDNDLNKFYELRYEVSGNTLKFQNLNNFGIKYINNLYAGTKTVEPYITTTFDSNGDFTIPGQAVGSFPAAAYYGYRTWASRTGFWYSTEYQGLSNYYLGSAVNSGSIKGNYHKAGVKHYNQKDASNYWAYDENIKGSRVRTIDGEAIEFDKIVYYDNLEKEIVSQSNNTLIFDFDNEVTHGVTMNLSMLDISSESGQIKIEGGYGNAVNNDYVESYDLYVVPGRHTAVNTSTFKLHAENGHADGVLIESGLQPTSSTETISINKKVPALKDIAETSQGQSYTAYLKANYKSESNLHPTFHALQTLNLSTGLESIEAEEVEGDAIYFNMNGQQVNSDNMAPGVYIKKQGNKTTKVVIK